MAGMKSTQSGSTEEAKIERALHDFELGDSWRVDVGPLLEKLLQHQ
jgi:hypothetical protein